MKDHSPEETHKRGGTKGHVETTSKGHSAGPGRGRPCPATGREGKGKRKGRCDFKGGPLIAEVTKGEKTIKDSSIH